MALPATIGTYGGPYSDARAVENPEVEMASDEGNRLLEDAAHLTRTSHKAFVSFTATTTGAPTTVEPTAWRTHWGSGPTQKPTIDKDANGEYTITFATTYDDALEETETLGFLGARVEAWSSVASEQIVGRKTALTANTVSIVIRDFGAGSSVDNISEDIKVEVWIS